MRAVCLFTPRGGSGGWFAGVRMAGSCAAAWGLGCAGVVVLCQCESGSGASLDVSFARRPPVGLVPLGGGSAVRVARERRAVMARSDRQVPSCERGWLPSRRRVGGFRVGGSG